MDALSKILPDDVAVVEESPTTTMGGFFERVGALKNTSGYFAQRGWALGWGMGCAVGVQMAWPQRPVLALIGDGSAMYGLQALWTAARYQVPATFVICNNSEYKILKDCAKVLDLPKAKQGQFVGMDIVNPRIDYVGLSESLGVSACRVEGPEELSAAAAEGLAGNRPRLIEVAVKRPGEGSYDQ